MFGLSSLRLGIYAAAALFVAVLVWSNHRLTGRLATAKAATAQATANLATERAAIAHERKINSEASNDYERRLKKLADDKPATPDRRVRCQTASPVPATATAASGVGEAASRRLPSETGFNPGYGSGIQTGEVDRWSDSGPDVGPLLYALADEANRAAAQCNALIKWVESR